MIISASLNNKTTKQTDSSSQNDRNNISNTSTNNHNNKKSTNSPTIKCKSLDVSLEDVLNCNDITIETTDEINTEFIDSYHDQQVSEQFECSSATLPRMKKCVNQSKSLPTSTATSFDCLSDDNCQRNHSMADDRDFVTKL